MRIENIFKRILLAATAITASLLVACSVHEWPYEEEIPDLPKYPMVLHLNYDTEMPQYKIIDYEVSRAEGGSDHDVRYTIEIYKIINEYLSTKELVMREVFSRGDLTSLDNQMEIELTEGKYTFHVWTDYVAAGTMEDKYYNADNFSAIVITKHEGNNDFRDAFVGHLEMDVTAETTDIYIQNKRPLAKFNFITTDLDEFVEQILEAKGKSGGSDADAGNGTSGVDINDYRVMFRYSQNMPSEYDHFLDMPVDITPNVRFESKINILSETEAEIGFDYVFTNDSDYPTPITVEVYDKEGNMVSSVADIPVPLKRGELTTIRSRFLTQKSSGGIGIDPDFEDPDYVYIVP